MSFAGRQWFIQKVGTNIPAHIISSKMSMHPVQWSCFQMSDCLQPLVITIVLWKSVLIPLQLIVGSQIVWMEIVIIHVGQLTA